MFKGVGMAGTTQNATLDEKEGLALVTLCPLDKKCAPLHLKVAWLFQHVVTNSNLKFI